MMNNEPSHQLQQHPTKYSALAALFLAIVHGITGLSILVISSWFIAISAVAPIGFNYVIPAVVIRALALLRIASGYASMWVGHYDLLSRIASTRLDVFKQLHNQQLDDNASMTEALARHTEAVASKWIAWVAPLSSVTLVFTALCVISTVLGLPGAFYLLIAFAVWLVIVALQALGALRVANANTQHAARFRKDSASFFHSSAIWHLYSNKQQGRFVHDSPSAKRTWQTALYQKKQALNASWWFQGFVYISISLLLGGVGLSATANGSALQAILGQVLLFVPAGIVVPMVLLAGPDWVSPSFSAISKYAQYHQSKHALSSLSATPIQTLPAQSLEKSLCLQSLRIKHRHISPISCTLPNKGVVVLKGPSGCGKSSMLQGMAGLLPTLGKRVVDNIGLAQGIPQNWLYVEQDPVVLAASVQMNLDVTGQGFDKSAMRKLLDELALDSLTLSTWVGKAGQPLSGGERKRLALARAVLAQPAVLLLDEPFEGLDIETQQAVSLVIKQAAQNALVVVASHVLPRHLNAEQTITLHTDSPEKHAVFAKV